MVYAVVSDVHANEMALSAVLEDALRRGAGRIICLGDVVGYGPEPEKTVSAIRRRAAVSLAGNHDDAVAGRIDASNFIDIAADAVARHRDALSPDSINWLKSLPYVFVGGGFACAHGDFTDPPSFEYVADEAQAAANFAVRDEQLLFVGHTHVPGIFLTGASGKTYSLPPSDFSLEDGKRYIVNPGSVGYPRSDGGLCESTYVLFDDAERTVTFHRLPFTVSSVMQTGRNPRRPGRAAIVAAICAATVVAGSAAWLLAPKERIETVTKVVTNGTARAESAVVTNFVAIAHADRTESCRLPPGSKRLLVAVKLAKGSPPAQLQLTFLDQDGNSVWEERGTAKRSRKKTFRIPAGSTSATLSAGRATGDIPACFDTFTLSAIP